MSLKFSEKYTNVLNAISEVAIIAYTDPAGRITFANEKFCQISGYSLDELVNQDHRILNSNYHSKEFFSLMYKTMSDGKVWRGEIRNKKKDGSFYWVDTQIIPIFNKEKIIESFASVRFDITERKKMEESLINLEKLASLGEISAVVAHEINNPLAVISMCSELLIKEENLENYNKNDFKVKLDKIINSAKRISKLVRGLKTFSRTSDEEAFATVDLKSFVDEALSFSRCKCIGSGIEFKLSEIPDAKFDCRPDQISQVLINLINNAHDATFHLKERWVELSVEVNSASNYLNFYVRDSGMGIPEQISEKILTPFFTTKEIGKGTGLGLSISKTIAEGHSGELYLDKTDKNTLFVFRVPLRQCQAVKAA